MKTFRLSPTRRLALVALVAGVLTAAYAPRARAALAVTDQSNTVGSDSFSASSGSSPQVNVVGQSFTPALAAMNAATFSLESFPINSGAPTATETLSVYAGAGFGGTLLGTSAPVTFSNTSFQNIEFDLPSVLTLIPGSTYTLALTNSANSRFVGSESVNNPYAGGTLYLYIGGNNIGLGDDAVFAEGVTSASLLVPEPSTWAAVALGAGLLSVVTRRRTAGV